ncbi:hypothetical protein [Haloferula sp. BvORR071]|uniref:hypothetical protein n=1 Tax=Haloferula sp. BvORR071 TaxID=1396141 RepID=UPI00054F6FC8|nr:hypothetical protein [Haloferula sp. BvORR071]
MASVPEKISGLGWIFNRPMLYGASLGFLVIGGCQEMQEAIRHHGQGSVFYERPDRIEKVDETSYRRHKATNAGLMLAFGLAGWIYLAKAYHNERPGAGGGG